MAPCITDLILYRAFVWFASLSGRCTEEQNRKISCSEFFVACGRRNSLKTRPKPYPLLDTVAFHWKKLLYSS